MKYLKVLFLLLLVSIATSCATVKFVTKVETVYRYPAKVTHPTLPHLTIYSEEDTVFTKETYKALLKEYSAFVVFTKQLLMIIKKHNEVIEEIKKEEDDSIKTEEQLKKEK